MPLYTVGRTATVGSPEGRLVSEVTLLHVIDKGPEVRAGLSFLPWVDCLLLNLLETSNCLLRLCHSITPQMGGACWQLVAKCVKLMAIVPACRYPVILRDAVAMVSLF